MATTTRDHEKIKQWAEERDAVPTEVKGTSGSDETGVLRFDFRGYGTEGDPLQEISWEEFFRKFDEKNLVFLYQDKTREGETSTFFKFISEETAEEMNE